MAEERFRGPSRPTAPLSLGPLQGGRGNLGPLGQLRLDLYAQPSPGGPAHPSPIAHHPALFP